MLLGVLARALAGIAREFRVGGDERHGLSGFGFCAAATSKKPSVKDGFVFCPVGIIAKYFGVVELAVHRETEQLTNTLPFCMMTGIAGAIMLVA